jgi:hypothetical protein
MTAYNTRCSYLVLNRMKAGGYKQHSVMNLHAGEGKEDEKDAAGEIMRLIYA